MPEQARTPRGLGILGLLLSTSTPAAWAQGSASCPPGQPPRFMFGFATLKAELASVMGDPLECERPNNALGDTVQRTSTGLAYYCKLANTPAFTDGWRHWALTADGLASWEGPEVGAPTVGGLSSLRMASGTPGSHGVRRSGRRYVVLAPISIL